MSRRTLLGTTVALLAGLIGQSAPVSPVSPKARYLPNATPRRVHPFKPNRRIDGTRYLPRFNESPEAQIERIQAAQAKRERRQARNLILRIGFNRETHYAK